MSLWNRIEQLFKRRALALLEKWMERGIVRPQLMNYGSLRRILVIRQHDYLGDFLLATPVLRALRESFPQAHVGVLVRGYTAELARHNRYINELLVFEEHGWNWTPGKIWRLTAGLLRGWDLAIVLSTVSHSLTSDLLVCCARPRYILGSQDRVFPGCKRNFLYNLEAPCRDGVRHQTERNLDIVRYLGVDTADRGEVITLQPQDNLFARGFLRRHQLEEDERMIALHIGAGKISNRWPVDHFAELANRLHHEYEVRVLVAWGAREKDLGKMLLERLSFQPIILQDISLRQLASIVSLVDVFVGNDTGVMHMAAAVGVPVVAIFGPTDPREWKPLGEKIVALRSSTDCADVSVEQVQQALLSLISPPLSARKEPPEEASSVSLVQDWREDLRE